MYKQYQALQKRQTSHYQPNLKLTGQANLSSFQHQLNTYTIMASLFSFAITLISLLMVHQSIDYVISAVLSSWWLLNFMLKVKLTNYLLLTFSIWLVNLYQLIAVYQFQQPYGLSLLVISFSICTVILSKTLQIVIQRRFK